jgi:GTPase
MALINTAVVGAVDAAKSTLIGVLSTGELDNGAGSARLHVLSQKHEKESGMTSTINLVNILSPLSKEKIEEEVLGHGIRLLDLAGHEKYLRSALRGLTNYFPNYALLVIDLSKGVTKITQEHMAICRNLGIPVIIVTTKVDICPAPQAKETFASIRILCKRANIKFIYEVKDVKSAEATLNSFSIDPNSVCPLFCVSNKTGVNIELLKRFLFHLPIHNRHSQLINAYMADAKITKLFFVHKAYNVKGAGLVVYGQNAGAPIYKNEKLLIGPIGNEYVEVRVRTIHNEHSEFVDFLETGRTGCLAIRPTDPKRELDRHSLRNGRVVVDRPIMVSRITAYVLINTHSTTIVEGYSPYVHCANVSITAKITAGEKFPLRSGEKSLVTFEFPTPQFIYPGARLVFRDGNVKGIGVVREVQLAGGEKIKSWKTSVG